MHLFSTHIKIGLLIALSVCVVSCTDIHEETAFERVIKYYREHGDTLKMHAAEYLRDNSYYHYGVARYWADSADIRVVLPPYDCFLTDTAMVDAIMNAGFHIIESSSEADRDLITDDFLINNINLAFDSWQRPWARDLSFADFCRYILPYRCADEELDSWRLYFKQKYEPTIQDSVSNPTSIREVATYLMHRLQSEVKYSPPMGRAYEGHFMSFTEMSQTHYLECRNLALYGTMALRACGIPCGLVSIYWRFNDVAHTSILIPATSINGKACRLSIYDDLQDIGEPKDSMASYRTWLYLYEADSSLLQLSQDSEIISAYWQPVTRHDITDQISKTYNISLPISEEAKKHQHAFLCRFKNWHWIPIREGKTTEDSIYFNKVTIRQWYRLGIITGDSLKTFGHTFTIIPTHFSNENNENYRLQYYDQSGDTVTYKLVYNCKPSEKRTNPVRSTYFWDTNDEWHEITQSTTLWGLNETTGEYRVFEESLRGTYKPVFHLMKVRLPAWTTFFDDDMPRPVGFICKDPVSNEGYTMQF